MPSTMKPFHQDCTTLFVGDLIFDRAAPDAVESVQRLLEERFRQWGYLTKIGPDIFTANLKICAMCPLFGVVWECPDSPPHNFGWWSSEGWVKKPRSKNPAPKTNSQSPWKISLWPQKERIINSNSNNPFSAVNSLLVSGRGYVVKSSFKFNQIHWCRIKDRPPYIQKANLQDVTPRRKL